MIKLFQDVTIADISLVGGKNASLGEMIHHLTSKGIAVPGGFAVTTEGFKHFITTNNLHEYIKNALDGLDVHNLEALYSTGEQIRNAILAAPIPNDLVTEITAVYNSFQDEGISFAVRSSATAEDLEDASFAGQQESYLNVKGIDNILLAVKKVFASLYNDRAISYRVTKGFAHMDVYISVGVQQMVRSDIGASGVMFTLDTESGFDGCIFITSSYGLGEMVVQGEVNPDEFYVSKHALSLSNPAIIKRGIGSKDKQMIYKNDGTDSDNNSLEIVPVDIEKRNAFSLSDEQVHILATYAVLIEQHYGKPMDIEWGLDGRTGELYILQARPETVQSTGDNAVIEKYQLTTTSTALAAGRAVGQRVASGVSKLIKNISQIHEVQPGDIIVTEMTDPNWEPVMKIAGGIVTDRGGRTCHAAIIARELGIPAIVGTTDGTHTIPADSEVTIDCSNGDEGVVYEGALSFEHSITNINEMPDIPTNIMLNIGNPSLAFSQSFTPNAGVGLARLEFIINNTIGIHPEALIHYDTLSSDLQQQIDERIQGYSSPTAFYEQKLIEGISQLAAAFYPKPVIVRMSDFKSNEYANLIGGSEFEPNEENPMIGFRGVSRYLSDSFDQCFTMECNALKTVRNAMGLDNVKIMIPFVRTVNQAKAITEKLASKGITRGDNGLELIMMCEVPSNVIMAEQFLEYFDGFSIGSNDLTQLSLGVDRDSGLVAGDFNENDEAVLQMMQLAIETCKAQGKYVGICGQAPSDFPELAIWLVNQGISSISLNPDSVIHTWLHIDSNT